MPSVTIRRDDAVHRCPVRVEGAIDSTVHRAIEIGIIDYDQWIFATHFELDAAEVTHAGFADAPPCIDGTGERDGIDQAVVEHFLPTTEPLPSRD